jgi:phosphoribosylaminoimidazole (AIR) synthetase
MVSEKSTSYKDVGVDIAETNEFVNDIVTMAKKTSRPGVIGGYKAYTIGRIVRGKGVYYT